MSFSTFLNRNRKPKFTCWCLTYKGTYNVSYEICIRFLLCFFFVVTLWIPSIVDSFDILTHILLGSCIGIGAPMGLLPDTQNCRCACAGNAGNVFPVTAGARSRHASRHVRHARAVMHVGIANLRFPLKSAAGENVPGIPGACATCNFTYLVRGPWSDPERYGKIEHQKHNQAQKSMKRICILFNIFVASHDHHGVSNHRQLYCLFNYLFWRISNKTCYCFFCKRNLSITVGFLSQKARGKKSVSMW